MDLAQGVAFKEQGRDPAADALAEANHEDDDPGTGDPGRKFTEVDQLEGPEDGRDQGQQVAVLKVETTVNDVGEDRHTDDGQGNRKVGLALGFLVPEEPQHQRGHGDVERGEKGVLGRGRVAEGVGLQVVAEEVDDPHQEAQLDVRPVHPVDLLVENQVASDHAHRSPASVDQARMHPGLNGQLGENIAAPPQDCDHQQHQVRPVFRN